MLTYAKPKINDLIFFFKNYLCLNQSISRKCRTAVRANAQKLIVTRRSKGAGITAMSTYNNVVCVRIQTKFARVTCDVFLH